MPNLVVPEFGVSNWQASRDFYCDILGFACLYERPEDGFSYLSLEGAELMIDQLGIGRTFEGGYRPSKHPFGKGVNVQIEVQDIRPLIAALAMAEVPLFVAPEDKWYRKNADEVGNRQFVVADPDGYLLRFFQSLGTRPAQRD